MGVFVVTLLLSGAALWWLHEPIALRLPPGSQVLDLEIEPGTSANGVAAAVVASGANVPALLLQTWCFCIQAPAGRVRCGARLRAHHRPKARRWK